MFSRLHDLVDQYTISISQMKMDILPLSWLQMLWLTSILTIHRLCLLSNMTAATSSAGVAYPSRAPELILFFVGMCYSSFSFHLSVMRSMFVFLFHFVGHGLLILLTISVCPFGIFKFLLQQFVLQTFNFILNTWNNVVDLKHILSRWNWLSISILFGIWVILLCFYL